jgi:hypothetical protein
LAIGGELRKTFVQYPPGFVKISSVPCGRKTVVEIRRPVTPVGLQGLFQFAVRSETGD